MGRHIVRGKVVRSVRFQARLGFPRLYLHVVAPWIFSLAKSLRGVALGAGGDRPRKMPVFLAVGADVAAVSE